MDEKRFITVLWVAKAALLVVLAYVAFEVATSRLRLVTMFDPGTASGQPQAKRNSSASVPLRILSPNSVCHMGGKLTRN